MFRILIWVLTWAFIITGCKNQQEQKVRITKNINSNWTFNYFPAEELDSALISNDIDDSKWPAIALPHTWQTYETTSELHPFNKSASERDDPYWWYGWGIYRKKFEINTDLKNKKIFIEMDGVQKYSRVYLNGNFIGDHKGGFTSFYFDLTPDINWEGENILTVAVNNKRNDQYRIPPMTAGNWNVYGGIYRDVRLVVKDKLHIPYQGSYRHEGGTFITTPEVNQENAMVAVKTYIKNEYDEDKQVKLVTKIYDPDGELVSEIVSNETIPTGQIKAIFQQSETIENPRLWSPQDPQIYRVESLVMQNDNLVDSYESPLGFRWFHWDYENDDLYINDKKMNILGTNRHQEYPWLGDAHPKWIARMDMYDIKYNLGHNFMRLTHYPNDKYLYQLADSFGIAMVEEVPNIKSIDFNEEVQEQNVREMIRRDRNHPSILFWSMGNETSDAADSKWAWQEDTTRIIHVRKGDEAGDYVQHGHHNLDMENLLRVTVRGWFDQDDAPEGFSSTPENGQHTSNETWQHQQARVRGGSVRGLLGDNCNAWLYEDHGADREYLNCILKHINPKGWVDMYRQPKYLYYLTKAYYTENPTVFIHPHFWRQTYLGQQKDVVVDANLDQVELFVDDKSYGVKSPDSLNYNTLIFENIPVTRGVLKAVGNKNGKKYENEVNMPEQPAKLTLETEQDHIVADRSGIAIVTANILDQNGHPVFDANNTLHWKVEGPAKLVGAETYESDIMKHEAWEGTGYTVVPVSNLIRSTNQPGEISVIVSSDGLEPAKLTIQSVKPLVENQWIKEVELQNQGREAIVRDPSYTNQNFIIEEIYPIRENHQIEGGNYASFRQNLERFINDRNRDHNSNSHGFKVLLDVLTEKIMILDGELIADDYNFIRDQYNLYRMLERDIENMNLDEKQKEELKEKYAKNIIRNSNPIDIEKEIYKIKQEY